VRKQHRAIFALYTFLALFLVMSSAVTGNAQSLIAGLAALSLITAVRYAARALARFRDY
jgi:hypothetical protein